MHEDKVPCTKVFNISEVQFMYFFSLVAHVFGVNLRTHCQIQGHAYLALSSKSFMVLVLILGCYPMWINFCICCEAWVQLELFSERTVLWSYAVVGVELLLLCSFLEEIWDYTFLDLDQSTCFQFHLCSSFHILRTWEYNLCCLNFSHC